MHMNAQGRVALMAKLGHTAGMQIQGKQRQILLITTLKTPRPTDDRS